MEILIAILILGSLGLLFGVGLAIASKKLAVAVDLKLEEVQHLLPGANCGACGNPGCFGFAESLLSGKSKVDACRVCSQEIQEKIAKVMGQTVDKQIKKIATLHCNGGLKVQDKYRYNGVDDCIAANQVLGGQKECVFACLGFGTCEKACPFGAIIMSANRLPIIDKIKCRSCNKCALACPKKILSLVSTAHPVYVACSSHDSGRDVKAICSVGCIACKLCEKACKYDAIHVVDNLAVIDYNKCTSCKACVEVCPAKTILVRA
ncbi:MAG: RnfABCDGE type electron transport complex subunit B [Candidatus Omnitrophota bacterium]